MSDAAIPAARGERAASASQLSENIGDVLASIRRLIAQDGAGPAAPDAAAPASRGSAVRRREILAQAQALSRRSDEAPARFLGAEGAAPVDLTLAGLPSTPLILGAAPAAEDGVVRVHLAPTTGPASPPGHVMEPAATRTATAGSGTAGMASPACALGPAGTQAVPSAVADTAGPPPLPPAEAAPPAPAAASAPSAAPATEACDAGPAPAAPGGLAPQEACTENGAPSLMASMIREIVRSELTQGSMPRDLRAMILREVAQVLAAPSR